MHFESMQVVNLNSEQAMLFRVDFAGECWGALMRRNTESYLQCCLSLCTTEMLDGPVFKNSQSDLENLPYISFYVSMGLFYTAEAHLIEQELQGQVPQKQSLLSCYPGKT